MKIRDRIRRELNENIRELLPVAFKEEFNIDISMTYNLFSGRMVTARLDKRPLTKSQYKWVQAYEKGYTDAWNVAVGE